MADPGFAKGEDHGERAEREPKRGTEDGAPSGVQLKAFCTFLYKKWSKVDDLSEICVKICPRVWLAPSWPCSPKFWSMGGGGARSAHSCIHHWNFTVNRLWHITYPTFQWVMVSDLSLWPPDVEITTRIADKIWNLGLCTKFELCAFQHLKRFASFTHKNALRTYTKPFSMHPPVTTTANRPNGQFICHGGGCILSA